MRRLPPAKISSYSRACVARNREERENVRHLLMILSWLPLALGVLMLGCDAKSTADRLQLTLGAEGGPVSVDTTCAETCGGNDQLALHVAYSDDLYPPQETIELLQYRIDYDLRGASKVKLPFFAGKTRITLIPGGSADVSLAAAGSAQRALALENHPTETLAGTATLSVAGYDWDNAEVVVTATFDIEFSDLGAADASNSTDAGAGDAP